MEPLTPKDQFPLADLSSPSQISEEEARAQNSIPAVRTYSSDLAEAIKDQQGSIVKIAIAEDEKHRRDAKENSPKSGKNISFMLGGLIVLGVAGVAIAGVLWYRARQSAAVQPVTVEAPTSVIRTEQFGTLDITGKDRDQLIAAIVAANTDEGSSLGTMKNILPTESTTGKATRVTASDFLAQLGTHAPADFSRALKNDYVVGAYYFSHTSKFLILEGTAHDYMQSGMLKWETTDMVADLGPLFGTTITDENRALITGPFHDMILKNQSVRAVLNADGTPALFYSFIDPDTIFIGTDPYTLSEVVKRFNK